MVVTCVTQCSNFCLAHYLVQQTSSCHAVKIVPIWNFLVHKVTLRWLANNVCKVRLFQMSAFLPSFCIRSFSSHFQLCQVVTNGPLSTMTISNEHLWLLEEHDGCKCHAPFRNTDMNYDPSEMPFAVLWGPEMAATFSVPRDLPLSSSPCKNLSLQALGSRHFFL